MKPSNDDNRGYRLGFPLESIPGKPAYILVAAVHSRNHFVVGGRPGALREGSGASRAAGIAPTEITEAYKLRFTPSPPPPDSTTPAQLPYGGNSDGAACALALANPAGYIGEGGPAVLVSCSINQFNPHHAFHGLKLASVTDDSQPYQKNTKSLLSKWEAAEKLNVYTGSALVLHRTDAALLAENRGIKLRSLDALEKIKPGKTLLIGVRENDLSNLAFILNGDPELFTPIGKQTTLKPKAKHLWFYIFATVSLLVMLGVFGASTFSKYMKQSPEPLKYETKDPTFALIPGEQSKLKLQGKHLDKMTDKTLSAWRTALKKEGLTVLGSSIFKVAGTSGNTSAVFKVDVPINFDQNSLPLPENKTGSTLQKREPITLRFRLRMAVVGYERDSKGAFERFFELLGTRIKSEDPRFDMTPHIQIFDQDDVDRLIKELRKGRWDIVRITPFVYLKIKWRLTTPDGQAPLELVACNQRFTQNGIPKGTYRSVFFSAKGSFPPFAKYPPSQTDLKKAIKSMIRSGKTIEFYWGKHNSTSGYVIPCLQWGKFIKENNLWNEGGSTTEINTLVRLEKSDAIRIGAINNSYLEFLMQRSKKPIDYDVLWRSQPLPHGGIAMVRNIGETKAAMYEKHIKILLRELHKNPDLIPKHQRNDVDLIGGCEHSQYRALERFLLASAGENAICNIKLLENIPKKNDSTRGPKSNTILVIESYHGGYGWDESYKKGIRQVLGDDYRIEYFEMDTKRIPKAAYEKQATLAWRRYKKLNPALVILGDDNALKYMGAKLSKTNTPVVFLGINDNPKKYLPADSGNITGVLERPLIMSAIRDLKKLLSKAPKKILILFDSGKTSISSITGSFGGKTRLRISGITADIRLMEDWDLWQQAILNSKKEGYDAIFVGLYHRIFRKSGKRLPAETAMKWISDNTPVPPFAFWEFAVGHEKTIGGLVVSGQEHGEEAARIAQKILEGVNPKDISPKNVNNGYYLFSKKQIKRHGIVLPKAIADKAILID